MATPLGYASTYEDDGGSLILEFPPDGYEFNEEQAYKRPVAPAFGSYSVSFSSPGYVFKEDADLSVRFELWVDPTDATSVMTTQDEFDEIAGLAAEIGNGKLYMTMPDGTRRWCRAEVMGRPSYAVDEISPFSNLPVAMQFRRLSDWMSTTKTTGSATSSPFSIVNAGSGRVFGKDAAFKLRIRSSAAGAGGGWTNPIVITNTTTGETMTVARASASVDDEIRITCGHRDEAVEYSTNNGSSYADDWVSATVPDDQATFFSLKPGSNNFTITGLVNSSVEWEFYPTWA